ncbi:uncharacterized protein CTRU02_204750 [Colletotrichum truncatum]|uniref:Uncharacterized protein n=1 Tax=Colletotrichum truncatum TaxID=5467 RepID=A0ACC3ZCY6_COLTU|nr:uncharacterized protein CTRU02_02984 [Colletotrichum truncatum]KAF6797942.1 hypothetical protein CTRU02_02984 [Colletotrichum truncatum]
MSRVSKLRLTDRGGFVNLNTTYPYYDHANAQSNPDLVARAYKAAYLNNVWTMMYFNVTTGNNKTTGAKAFSYLDSELNKEFPLKIDSLTNYRAVGLSQKYGNYLSFTSGLSTDKSANWSNPFGVDADKFKDAQLICSGAGSGDYANISNIYVGCGLLRGAPKRVDDGIAKSLFENHSKWSSTLHSCAATVRAVVKTVTFTVNGTDGLNSLKVTSVSTKNYTSPEEYPLWGMEDSGLKLDGVSPVWGIISPEYATRPNISSVRQPVFHLPGYSSSVFSSPLEVGAGVMLYNLPGSDFARNVMDVIFSKNTGSGGALGTDWPFDLAGAANMPIFKRWQSLSSDSDRISRVLELLWTDIAASAVVGTKGALGAANSGAEDETTRIVVQPYGRRIKYRYAFGIPAFILLLVMISILTVLIATAIFASSTVTVLRRRIQQLTVGRVLTTFLYPENSNLFISSKEWSQNNGEKVINLGGAPQKTTSVHETHVQYPPVTPAEEVTVGLMGGDRKPGY